MNKKTNMKLIRALAVDFLNVEIQETRMPVVASHPFTGSWFAAVRSSKGVEMVDLHEPYSAQKWREMMAEEINKSDLVRLFMLLHKPYILNFLKFAEPHMSAADLGTVLGAFWTHIEQISLDDSVTGQEIVRMFKRASKDTLMDEDARAIYDSLPDEVTIYRGVTSHNRHKKQAFSWTTDKDVAKRFANRFDTGTGEIWTLTVPKERVLCSMGDGEWELIVNLYGYDGLTQMIVEKV